MSAESTSARPPIGMVKAFLIYLGVLLAWWFVTLAIHPFLFAFNFPGAFSCVIRNDAAIGWANLATLLEWILPGILFSLLGRRLRSPFAITGLALLLMPLNMCALFWALELLGFHPNFVY